MRDAALVAQEACMTTPTKDGMSVGDPGLSLRAHAPTTSARSTARYFDSELAMLPGVKVPLRSMLVNDGSEKILISPVATSEEHAAIGEDLTTLVVPDLLHHKYLADAIHRYQPATLWAPPGFTDKVPDFAPVRVFGMDTWPHYNALDYVLLEGAPRKNEVVFFHRTSRTLYAADLFFNIREPKGWLTPVTFRMMGVYKRFAVAKIMKRWIKDPAAFRRSIAKMLEWDFERIVVAHGEPVDRDARELAVRALREGGMY